MTSFKMQSLKGLLIAYRRRKGKRGNKPVFGHLQYVYGHLAQIDAKYPSKSLYFAFEGYFCRMALLDFVKHMSY